MLKTKKYSGAWKIHSYGNDNFGKSNRQQDIYRHILDKIDGFGDYLYENNNQSSEQYLTSTFQFSLKSGDLQKKS